MTKTPLVSLRHQLFAPQRGLSAAASVILIALSVLINPALAGDPFRNAKPRAIGSKTEVAFKAMFEQGNYKAAKTYVEQALSAEPNEPMVYAMKASLSYIDKDLESLSAYAKKTREVAERLTPSDPLRGNIYIAVSHFLEGAYTVAKEGSAKGTATAMSKLRVVFQHLEAAEKIDPNDPELNLLKGYMDLMLSTNLPFSNPNQAIQRLENKASPRYLAYRGAAIGYRDLNKTDRALQAVNQALAQTPNNPEILYLKAQILVFQSKQQNNNRALMEEARKNFQAALVKPDQLPKETYLQIFLEHCKNLDRLDGNDRKCRKQQKAQRNQIVGNWGPPALPKL